MAALIDAERAPYEAELEEVIGTTDSAALPPRQLSTAPGTT
jgi:hypothetical protein